VTLQHATVGPLIDEFDVREWANVDGHERHPGITGSVG